MKLLHFVEICRDERQPIYSRVLASARLSRTQPPRCDPGAKRSACWHIKHSNYNATHLHSCCNTSANRLVHRELYSRGHRRVLGSGWLRRPGMLIQRLWASPRLIRQGEAQNPRMNTPETRNLPNHQNWHCLVRPLRSGTVYESTKHIVLIKHYTRHCTALLCRELLPLCLLSASSCAIATRCNQPSKLSLPLKARSLLPRLLAVVRGELGKPLAELIVLLIIAFQLRGHCPNDGFAFICARKLLQIMR